MKATYKGGIKARLLMIGWFLFMAIWSIFTPKVGAEIIESWIEAKNKNLISRHNAGPAKR